MRGGGGEFPEPQSCFNYPQFETIIAKAQNTQQKRPLKSAQDGRQKKFNVHTLYDYIPTYYTYIQISFMGPTGPFMKPPIV